MRGIHGHVGYSYVLTQKSFALSNLANLKQEAIQIYSPAVSV